MGSIRWELSVKDIADIAEESSIATGADAAKPHKL